MHTMEQYRNGWRVARDIEENVTLPPPLPSPRESVTVIHFAVSIFAVRYHLLLYSRAAPVVTVQI